MANAARAFEPVDDEAPPGRGAGPWPQGASRAPSFSIGRVVESLRSEFPAVTLSKIRFLEDQGLVRPARTGAGYRKYSEADVERIRFVLTEQRDSFTPLRVIGEKLAALDAGHDPGPSRKAQVVASEGRVVSTQGRRFIPASDLCDLTGVDVDTVTRYARLGLITPDLAGYFPSPGSSPWAWTRASCAPCAREPTATPTSSTRRCPRRAPGAAAPTRRGPRRAPWSWGRPWPTCTGNCCACPCRNSPNRRVSFNL